MRLFGFEFGPQSPADIFSLALWLAGIGHFCVLAASFQVPSRLHWKEELSRLSNFNRKLMWVHGAFAVLTIIAFGTLTLTLHNEMLRGDRAALSISAFIGIYWSLRVLVDIFYYDHRDWPAGRSFKAGHALLTFLFVCLALTNLGLVIWRTWNP
jgi:Mn2+/Fe2+ NRAMP family transporter